MKTSVLPISITVIIFTVCFLQFGCRNIEEEEQIGTCNCAEQPMFLPTFIDSLKLEEMPGFWPPDSIILKKDRYYKNKDAYLAGKEYSISELDRRIYIEIYETPDMALFQLEEMRKMTSLALYEGDFDHFGVKWWYYYYSKQCIIWFNKSNVNINVYLRSSNTDTIELDSIISIIETIPPIIIERIEKWIDYNNNQSLLP